MGVDGIAFGVWLALLLVLLCVRVWVCIKRMAVKYERDKQDDGVDAGGTR